MHSGGLPLSPVAPKRVHRAQAARALVPKQGKTPAGEWIHEVDALSSVDASFLGVRKVY